VGDKDLNIEKVICEELNIPAVDVPEVRNSPNMVESSSSHHGKQVQSYQYRHMQRAQIEFIKKRLGLLEKGLIAECQKEYFVSALGSMVHNFYVITELFSL